MLYIIVYFILLAGAILFFKCGSKKTDVEQRVEDEIQQKEIKGYKK